MAESPRDPTAHHPRSGAEKVLAHPPVFRPGLPGWLLFGTIAVGAVLRLSAASHGGLWRDEAMFLFVSRIEPFSKLLNFLRLHESHPPGFYLLMRWWSGLLGRSESAAVGLVSGFRGHADPARLLRRLEAFQLAGGTLRRGARCGVPALDPAVHSCPPVRDAVGAMHPHGVPAVGVPAWSDHRDVGAVCPVDGRHAVHAQLDTAALGRACADRRWLAGTRSPDERKELLRPWIRAQGFILLAYEPWIPVLVTSSATPDTFPHRKSERVPISSLRRSWREPTCVGSFHLPPGGAGGVAPLAADPCAPPRGEGLLLGLVVTAGIPAIVIVMAFLLSRTTNLLAPWCVAVLSPLALFAFARFQAWVHETGAWREAYVSGRCVVRAVLLDLVLGPGEPQVERAGDRHCGGTRATAGGDLVIVTPETLASSFNFYFRPKNPQIDFPSMRREQVVRYDDRLNRLSSETGLVRAMARIDTARAQGRRVWFVMEASDMADRFVRPLVPADTARGYLQPLMLKQSNQLRQHLVALYGAPTLRLMPAPRDQALELIGALLFEPALGQTQPRWPGGCRVRLWFPAGRQDQAELPADTAKTCSR